MADVAKNIRQIESEVLFGLKDFQKATVERIHELYQSGTRRILVSDEVGLGKTLIARGAIAKLARLRIEEGDDLFKVVYICSNAAIAGQNLAKLRISRDLKVEDAGTSRLSMQHLRIFLQDYDPELKRRFIQLIPITPDTSFRMAAGSGSVDERALMYAILSRLPELGDYLDALEVAMMDYAVIAWESQRDCMKSKVDHCDMVTDGNYLRKMLSKVGAGLHEARKGEMTYYRQLVELCGRISAAGNKRVRSNAVIGKLRVLFAQISVDLLEPDFVIMDEFQRYKFIIALAEDEENSVDKASETKMLVKRFFNSPEVRILMLSATPYKMYSTLEEIEEAQSDDHFSEFLQVVKFLGQNPSAHKAFKETWSDYSAALREFAIGSSAVLELESKAKKAEGMLYGMVCRTERISEAACADLVDDSSKQNPVSVSPDDIRSYLDAERLLAETQASAFLPVDYVKSAPYLLSFMRNYQLKRNLERYFMNHPKELNKAQRNTLWLQRGVIEKYSPLNFRNARLAEVMRRAFEQRSERLLWVPPSKPYYELSGPFKGTEGFSKTLVFSSWEMVPRMIATLVSYESERKNIAAIIERDGRDSREARYFSSDNKRYPAARLNFSVSSDRLGGMPLFCLLYPSHFLAACFNPIDAMNRGLTQKQLEGRISEMIAGKLAIFPRQSDMPGREDERWYYLAPLLLDEPKYVLEWLKSSESLLELEEEQSKREKGYITHWQVLQNLWKSGISQLGKQPADLVSMLTAMAMASPAVCVYRTYLSQSGLHEGRDSALAAMAGRVAKVFINRLNTSESTAVIEACYGKSEDAHWKNVLRYCKAGNLQALFDEYAHVLIECNGLRNGDDCVGELHRLIHESLSIRTVLYAVDSFNKLKSRIENWTARPLNMRSHFAVAFTKGDDRSDRDTDRKKTVRNAFNSPFRPFVLATTSIGQEGLDFHYYCRRIVHWNLPSNPIDLEQREGRINRFKGLVIRQNIARRYGGMTFAQDVWDELFDMARRSEKTPGGSDLIPFWGLTEGRDMLKIERVLPMYPFSRDVSAYERLIKILSLYRLTLGQTRQEELLEYISAKFDAGDLKNLFINLSPFYKQERQSRRDAGEDTRANKR